MARGGIDRKKGHYFGRYLEALRKRLEREDVLSWNTHSLRRSMGTAMINAEVPEITMNRCLGWSQGERMGAGVYAKRGDWKETQVKAFTSALEQLGGPL